MFSYTVSEVNKFIKQIFSYEQIFYNISVKGEISNFKYHDSGNLFFTLKDENSSIKCVMFKMHADLVKFMPKNGMFVNVQGDINIYEKTGTYQIYINKIEKQGEGLIQKKLLNLHQKLLNEGLFDSCNKIPLIKIPKVVGVVTASNGAALQDVIKILSARFPILKLKIFPCLVQGVGAAVSISRAIKKVSSDEEVDNVIVCRGGGSKEDLNPFDDEAVCRAAFECEKPLISAIGHETDHCLLDLVADLRAPTPSAAAELVCAHKDELIATIENKMQFFMTKFNTLMENNFLKLKNFQNRLEALSPKNFFENCEFKIEYFSKKINQLMCQTVINLKNKIEKNWNILKILNPLNVLSRGYCLAVHVDNNNNISKNKIVKSAYETKVGDELTLILNKGKLKVKILDKQLELKALKAMDK